jgi:hypothetical protein
VRARACVRARAREWGFYNSQLLSWQRWMCCKSLECVCKWSVPTNELLSALVRGATFNLAKETQGTRRLIVGVANPSGLPSIPHHAMCLSNKQARRTKVAVLSSS